MIEPSPATAIQLAIIDDDHSFAECCAAVLRFDGYQVTTWDRPSECLDALRRRPFDVVVTALHLPHLSGRTVLQAALALNPACLVILTTDQPSVDGSIELLSEGAWEYLPKPFSAGHLRFLVARAAREVARRQGGAPPAAANDEDPFAILGCSAALENVLETARKVASTDASVFLTGESGSGKELVARYIHRLGRRASRPFYAVNCAALPEPLLESEMFGHRRGAFTGAHRDKPGLLETASGGTLLLDELGEMPASVQAKLLRVIQDGCVRRVGSEGAGTVVDVRFISATNRDPRVALETGALREDLYYRLRVVPIHLPPLRERVPDIPVLAQHFFATAWQRHHPAGEPAPELTPGSVARLMEHPWRGNVRELRNFIEHLAVISAPGTSIGADDLQLTEDAAERPVQVPRYDQDGPGTYHATRERVIAQFELEYFSDLLERAGGNMSLAARLAGVDRTTLYRLAGRHNLPRPGRRSWPPQEAESNVA